MLELVRAKARDLGQSDAIQTVQADLDTQWPAVGPVDLAWASASMHHLADPDRVLGEIFGAIRPGGLLAVAELSSFPRFLSGDLGDELEERCHAVLDEARARDLPHIGDDWGTRLAKAGFTVEQNRTFTIDLTPPLPAATAATPGFAAAGPDRTGGPDQRRGPGHARRTPGRQRPGEHPAPRRPPRPHHPNAPAGPPPLTRPHQTRPAPTRPHRTRRI